MDQITTTFAPIPARSLSTYGAGLLQAKAYRTLNREFGSYLAEYNLSMSDWSILGMLSDVDTTTNTAVAEILDVTPAMATKLISGLENANLVMRRSDREDSRVKYVFITPKGRDAVEAIEPQLRDRMRALLGPISPSDLSVYLGVLKYLSNATSTTAVKA